MFQMDINICIVIEKHRAENINSAGKFRVSELSGDYS